MERHTGTSRERLKDSWSFRFRMYGETLLLLGLWPKRKVSWLLLGFPDSMLILLTQSRSFTVQTNIQKQGTNWTTKKIPKLETISFILTTLDSCPPADVHLKPFRSWDSKAHHSRFLKVSPKKVGSESKAEGQSRRRNLETRRKKKESNIKASVFGEQCCRRNPGPHTCEALLYHWDTLVSQPDFLSLKEISTSRHWH